MNTVCSLFLLALLLLLAGCDDAFAPPSPTAQATLSGPSIEASPTLSIRQPTVIPYDELYSGSNDPTAAALPPDSALPPLAVGSPAPVGTGQTIQVTGMDGALLPGVLYQNREGLRLPGVLLLAPRYTDWGDFPEKLHLSGYTVLAMSMREEGALLDFTVMIQALSTGEADPASLAVIGAGAGADIALLGCAGELLCDTVVLLSPSGNPALLEAMNQYNPRPLLVSASQNDLASFTMAQQLETAATGEVLLQPFGSAGNGTQMLVNRPDLGDLLIQWLEQMIG
jgi:hypothetical protein